METRVVEDYLVHYTHDFLFLAEYFDDEGRWAGPRRSGIDIETEGVLNPWDGEIATVQIEINGDCYVVHIEAPGSILDVDGVALLQAYLEDDRVVKVIHNASFELKWFLKYFGRELHCGPVHDTMAGEYILAEGHGWNDEIECDPKSLALGRSVLRRYGVDLDKDNDLRTSFRRKGCVEMVPQPDAVLIQLVERVSEKTGKPLKPKEVKVKVPQPPVRVEHGLLSDRQLAYAASDAIWCARLATDQLDEMARAEIEGGTDTLSLLDLDSKTAEAIARMELAGMPIDQDELRVLCATWEYELEMMEEELQSALMGDDFEKVNLNSAQQMPKALERVGVKVGKYKSSLLKRHRGHPVVDKLLQYKKFSKLHGTYAKSFLEKINSVTGRVHGGFNQFLAATGRLSSSNPNLQNIPVRTPEGRALRALVVAPPGKLLISADYSNIEMRLIAEIYNDENMIRAFQNKIDVHCLLASQIMGIPYDEFMARYNAGDEVCIAARQSAKPGNFGLGYGAGVGRLQGIAWEQYDQDWSWEHTEKVRNAYLASWPGVPAYHEQAARLIKNGVGPISTSTVRGRKRTFPQREWMARDSETGEMRRKTCFSAYVNHPIQGTSADITKEAMWELCRKVDIILQVHDEIVVLADEDKAQEVAELMKATMEAVGQKYCARVPIEVDYKIGTYWKK